MGDPTAFKTAALVASRADQTSRSRDVGSPKWLIRKGQTPAHRRLLPGPTSDLGNHARLERRGAAPPVSAATVPRSGVLRASLRQRASARRARRRGGEDEQRVVGNVGWGMGVGGHVGLFSGRNIGAGGRQPLPHDRQRLWRCDVSPQRSRFFHSPGSWGQRRGPVSASAPSWEEICEWQRPETDRSPA